MDLDAECAFCGRANAATHNVFCQDCAAAHHVCYDCATDAAEDTALAVAPLG